MKRSTFGSLSSSKPLDAAAFRQTTARFTTTPTAVKAARTRRPKSLRKQSESLKRTRRRPSVKARYARALSQPGVRARTKAMFKAKMKSQDTIAKLQRLRATPEYHQKLSERTREGLARNGIQRPHPFIGVHPCKDCKMFEVRIRIGQRRVKTLGHFHNAIDAARAYNKGIDDYRKGVGKKNRIDIRRQVNVPIKQERRMGKERRVPAGLDRTI